MSDNIKVVSSQTEADVRCKHSQGNIKNLLREMLANLLRVQRGRGKEYEIPNQIIELAVALSEYIREFGNIDTSVLVEAINIDRSYPPGSFEDGQEQVLQGAMQLIASRLLGQSPQESQGRREMCDGISVLEEIRSKNRPARKPDIIDDDDPYMRGAAAMLENTGKKKRKPETPDDR